MGFKSVRLGDVVTHRKAFIEIRDSERYKRCRVQLHARGIVQRDIVEGASVRTKRQQVCTADQFLVAEIDAKVGGFGLVPKELEGAIVSSHYFLYDVDRARLEPEFLGYYARTPQFRDQVKARGSTNYASIRPDQVLEYTIPLPSVDQQRRVIRKVSCIEDQVRAARKLREEIESDLEAMLAGAFAEITQDVQHLTIEEVAPIVRRPVEVEFAGEYAELGVRSFGKGTFHKPVLQGSEVGTKRLYHIEPGDVVLSNVFAWEGAIAVALERDRGRVGSHRFITCVPKQDAVTANFIRFYFLSAAGMAKIRKASPGGAGRNRTLGLRKLEKLTVPIPSIERQVWFDEIHQRAESVRAEQQENEVEFEALVPAILDKAFKGEL